MLNSKIYDLEVMIKAGFLLKKEIKTLKNNGLTTDVLSYMTDIQNIESEVSEWKSKVQKILKNLEWNLIDLKIENFYDEQGIFTLLDKDRMPIILEFLQKSINELITHIAELDKSRREKAIVMLTIDDIDNFKPFLKDVERIDKKYIHSAFLEDDVENVFLEILGEPYKENDSGAETRDLYTNNLIYEGKRLYSALMFKGRGLKEELNLSHAGKNGNQLLKLAKNSSAQLFLIQHVNKINPEVTETLKDHLLSYSPFDKVYICIVDGKDTARLLKGKGCDLEELKSKKHHSGRKPKPTTKKLAGK